MSGYLPEAREPTHLLTITVPLNMNDNPSAESYDIQGALAQAVNAIMPLLRLATLGLLCGGPEVRLDEAQQ